MVSIFAFCCIKPLTELISIYCVCHNCKKYELVGSVFHTKIYRFSLDPRLAPRLRLRMI